MPRAVAMRRVAEWPTLLLLVATYGLWALATVWVAQWSVGLAIALCAWAGAQHSSLTHEALHGHPFRSPFWNGVLVFPALTLAVPYIRFRDTHLAHHDDEKLTDPYDDPETNYLDPSVWSTLPMWKKAVYRLNNTLLGRLLIGPLVGQVAFLKSEWSLVRCGETRVILAWLVHIPAVALVVWWIAAVAVMPIWAWLVSVYLSLSLLKLRTYLEHQAHEETRARTAIVEDRGPFALLFLNNNLHAVHHLHPSAPWYALPTLYRSGRQGYLSGNRGYRFRTYGDVFRTYFLSAKDPVPHPYYEDGHSR